MRLVGCTTVRVSAIFIAVCMVLIAGSLGALLYLRFGFAGIEAAVAALGVLSALAVYNAVSGRTSDRAEITTRCRASLAAPAISPVSSPNSAAG